MVRTRDHGQGDRGSDAAWEIPSFIPVLARISPAATAVWIATPYRLTASAPGAPDETREYLLGALERVGQRRR